MAIAFDATSNNSADTQNLTVSHTATGSDRFALIGVMNSGTAPSSVTYGGSACTLILTEGRLHLYRITAPATGAQNVTANQGSVQNTIIGVVTYAGVDQTTPIGTAVSNTNTEQTSISVDASSSTGNLVVDFSYLVAGSMSVGASQTARINLPTGGAPPTGHDVGFLTVGMSEEAGAASVTMSWSTTETFGDNYIIAVPLIAAAGGGGGGPNVTEARKFGPQGFLRTIVNL